MLRILTIVKIKVISILRKSSDLLTAWVSSSRSSTAFFISLLAMVLCYRIQLTMGLYVHPVKPFDFDPANLSFGFTVGSLTYDFTFVLACYWVSGLLSQVTIFMKGKSTLTVFKISGISFLQIFLLLLTLIHGIHGRLLFDVQTGLETSAIREAFADISLIETIKLIEIRDYLFLLLPYSFFWLVFLLPLGARIRIAGVSILMIIFLSSLSIVPNNDKTKKVTPEIRFNPVLFFLSDVANDLFFKNSTGHRNINPLKGDRPGFDPPQPMEAHLLKSRKFLPAKSTHPWNILFFVMESAGTRYIFDQENNHPMPMPFLRKISKEGWFLKKHFTTSNVSTKAIFSLFSGLYDLFKRENFGTRLDAEVPAVYNWMGEGYDRFLVTPSSISWYFPAKFIQNTGLREIYSYENLKFRIKEEVNSLGHYIARDEIQTVDFFIQRLSKAREPFLGIYISFAAHFPYFDYGGEYRIRQGEDRLLSRYYNNLNLLDHMIKRIVDYLKDQGLMDRTLLVIVGDHGQAFGQHHPNNFMHYRYSYNENLETPAIFYQPKLFHPKTMEFPTSHVDILPTLLDAARISYPSVAFDGESLFQNPLRQRSLYFYGYEESVSSLDSNLIKIQYSFKKNQCQVFDLNHDPNEERPLDCSRYPFQVEALHRFVNDHDEHLMKYNASLKERGKPSEVPVPVAKK